MKIFSPIPHRLEFRHNKSVEHEKDKSFEFDGENLTDIDDELIAPYKRTFPEKYLTEEEFEEYKKRHPLPLVKEETEKIYPFEPEPGKKVEEVIIGSEVKKRVVKKTK